jgi:NADH-quinone oxidoreductase subunit A
LLTDFGQILLFILAPVALIGVVMGAAAVLRKQNPNEEKLTTYESGEDPVGNANIQFNVRFYVVALVFLLFEVELLFLFPWAVVFGNEELIEQTNGLWGWFAFAEMTVFVGILILGLAYAWAKGYLDWVKPKEKIPEIESKVPVSMYQALNQKYATKPINIKDSEINDTRES